MTDTSERSIPPTSKNQLACQHTILVSNDPVRGYRQVIPCPYCERDQALAAVESLTREHGAAKAEIERLRELLDTVAITSLPVHDRVRAYIRRHLSSNPFCERSQSASETECGLCASGMNSFTDPDTGTRIHARNGTVTPCSAQKAAETYSRQAPIARVKVAPDRCYTVELYAPGLPPGDHDLYCEPEAVAPMMREKRAYYETHDPPHCPTCSCGLPREDACSCGRVELKDGYVRASCADGSVHTKAGCNSPSKAKENQP